MDDTRQRLIMEMNAVIENNLMLFHNSINEALKSKDIVLTMQLTHTLTMYSSNMMLNPERQE